MDERTLRKLGMQAAAVLAGAALLTAVWDARSAAGVLAGGAWNLASLWCLAQLLRAWLGNPQPSKRRVIVWLLLKFPLLYVLAFGLLRLPLITPMGFGAGFTLVLVVALFGVARVAQHLVVSRPHGR